MREKLARQVVPGLIMAISTFTLPARLMAAARRAAGRSGKVELFFAYDEPASAYALIELAETVKGRAVKIELIPVVRRGIEDDPAHQRKRVYGIVDGRRLARRIDRTLGRGEPLEPQSVAFLAAWTALAQPGPALQAFAIAAMEMLWFGDGAPVERERFAALWREEMGCEPPDERSPQASEALRANERRMKRSGPYETPAAKVGARWDFAHDRPRQIGAWLDELGWRKS